MSKKVSENKNTEESKNMPSTSPDKFSFLELDKILNEGNLQKKFQQKSNKKKPQIEKKEPAKIQKLKILPNSDIAREHTDDDLMFIEKEEDLKKEEPAKEEKKEKIPEKIIPKNNIEKKKIDRRLVKINLDKVKSDEKSKNKSENTPEKKDEKSKNKSENNIESIIKNIKEKDPQAYTPVMLPFEEDKDGESDLKIDLNENKENLYIFQFPRKIPIKDLKGQIEENEEEEEEEKEEEENLNKNPNKDKDKALKIPKFKNIFKEIKENTVIGKLVIMKSGKIKIKMGDTYFDINQGSKAKFAQFSAIITGNENEDNQTYILGQPMNKKLIVTPEFE